MPNWCRNRLTIVGSPERVAAFVKKANGPTQTFKTSEMEIRMWEQQCRAAVERGVPQPKHPSERDREPNVLAFHQLRPIPDEVMAKEYDPAGYEAEHKLWGCKWGSCRSKLVKHEVDVKAERAVVEYEFDTPWGPAFELFEFLTENDWKDLLFVCSWSEEFPTRGRFALLGGVILANVVDDHKMTGGVQKYVKAHDKWVKELIDGHAKRAPSVGKEAGA